MFGFFKRRKRTSKFALVLDTDAATFVSLVKSILEESQPAALTMCVVAFQNLESLLSSCQEFSKTKRGKDLPADLDGFIRMLCSRLDEELDEGPERRLMWFYQAALIQRATNIASQNPNLLSDISAIWVMLAQGSAGLCHFLPANELWSDDEKAYFSHIKNEHDGIWYCLKILAPSYLRSEEGLRAFADSQGILLLPW